MMQSDSAYRWYSEGFNHAIAVNLDRTTKIKIFSLPYFIASKWEAFKGRGKGEYRTSKDFEDLVYVFENADDLEDQLNQAPAHLQEYFWEESQNVINTDDFEEGLYAHMQSGYSNRDANSILLNLKKAFKIL